MNENSVTLERWNDPALIARIKARRERAQRNCDWLDAHLDELLPQARGKLVAVAGQEAFIADTHAKAWAWARAAHSEDEGAISQHVRSSRGPRIYQHPGPRDPGPFRRHPESPAQ